MTPFKNKYNEFFEGFTKKFKGTSSKYKVYSDIMPNVLVSYFDKIFDVCEKVHEFELVKVKDILAVARFGEESLRRTLKDQQV